MTIDFIEKYFEHHIAPFYLKSPALHNYEIMHSKDIEKCRNFMDYSITIKTRKVAASLHKEPHPEDPSSPSHTYTQLSSKSVQLSPRHVCVCVCVCTRAARKSRTRCPTSIAVSPRAGAFEHCIEVAETRNYASALRHEDTLFPLQCKLSDLLRYADSLLHNGGVIAR